jgi:hypothetical protein
VHDLAAVDADAHSEVTRLETDARRELLDRGGERETRANRTSASSSRVRGTPKTAIAASPMNFSSLPP